MFGLNNFHFSIRKFLLAIFFFLILLLAFFAFFYMKKQGGWEKAVTKIQYAWKYELFPRKGRVIALSHISESDGENGYKPEEVVTLELEGMRRGELTYLFDHSEVLGTIISDPLSEVTKFSDLKVGMKVSIGMSRGDYVIYILR